MRRPIYDLYILRSTLQSDVIWIISNDRKQLANDANVCSRVSEFALKEKILGIIFLNHTTELDKPPAYHVEQRSRS